jgi:dienelactone hydrolase
LDAIKVSDEGLVANLYLPATSGKAPAVIVISGSDGGIATASTFGEPLAALGYVVLSLAYFAMDGLPLDLVEVPLEYFKRAIDWLRAHPAVDAERLALVGHSRGGEGALVVASAYPQIRLVVANVPSHVVWNGIHPVPGTHVSAWSVNGTGLPYLSLTRRPEDGKWSEAFEDSLGSAPAARIEAAEIPVERINGPVLFISGTDDRIWPSTLMSERAIERMRRHAFRFDVEHARYEDGGHAVLLPPYRVGPASNPWPSSMYTPPKWSAGQMPAVGGTSEGNRLARADAWPRMTRFLQQHL